VTLDLLPSNQASDSKTIPTQDGTNSPTMNDKEDKQLQLTIGSEVTSVSHLTTPNRKSE
jgi:hypothetical protein